MIYLLAAAALTVAILAFLVLIRPGDLPKAIPMAPWKHLDDRKTAIYENLRDLQFEYRVGKLSDADYARTKTELQSELAGVLAEIDRMKASAMPTPKAAGAAAGPAKGTAKAARKCPHCGAQFDRALRFCGECGKAMVESA